MGELRWAARLYWVAAILAALALFGLLFVGTSRRDDHGVVLALAFAALLILVLRFPLHVAPQTKLALDTAVLFAVTLLFDPVVAVALAGLGTLLAQGLGRQGWLAALFNSAQAMLRIGVAALLLAAVGWDVARLSFAQPEQLLGLAAAAGAIHVVNALVVQTMVALQTGLALLPAWRHGLALAGVEELAQVALGLLAAAIVDVHPWALSLLVLPALVTYRALERHIQLRQQTLDAVEGLAAIVDLRDRYTAEHSRRVADVARELAIALGLSPEEAERIERAARMHDVGKIIVDPGVLAKAGRLDAAEWEQVRRHPVTGAEILGRFPQLALATRYVRHHHERIDGGGYPDGLRGEAIPLGARIIAVADALDAMTTARPYRPALTPQATLAEFVRQRGYQWDERVVAALLELVAQGRIVLEPEHSRSGADAAPSFVIAETAARQPS